jgi:hypothetical protein
VLPLSRAGGRHPIAQHGAVLDQGIDPLPAEPLGELDRRLHRQDGPGRVVDDVAQPVVAALGEADLGALHHHHPLARV